MTRTPTESQNLRTFLSGNPWFLEGLRKEEPKIEGESFEKTALSGSKSQGYRDAVALIEKWASQPMPSRMSDPGFIPNEK